MQTQVDIPAASCSNCGTLLAGEHCHACGQRRLRDADRRLGHLLRELLENLTDLDGRFWRSLRTLMLRPGVLSRDWIDGRRARWMSPVSLFLLANVLYFFAPALTDFDLPLRDHVRGAVAAEFGGAGTHAVAEDGGQLHSRFTEPWVRARLAEMAREKPGAPAFDTLSQRYAIASANVSKALIVLHVPFLALLLMLAMAGRGRTFAEHFVVALHYFAFVLFVFELVVLPLSWLAARFADMPSMSTAARVALTLVVATWGVFAVRRAYACGWLRALLVGPGLLVALLAVNVIAYRTLQFVIVLALT